MNYKQLTVKYKLSSGQAMIIATLVFLSLSVSVMFGTASPALRQSKITEHYNYSRQSFLAAESGVEDVVYRLKKGKQVGATEVISVGGAFATTTLSDVGSNEKELISSGNAKDRVRKSKVGITVTGGTSFSYGVQTGDGGFILENNATVVGNVYSNGPVIGQNSNLVKGDVVSAGVGGVVDGIHATGTAYAHKIKNSDIDKDAHYQIIENTTVDGVSYPDSSDLPKQNLPISDSLVSGWETEASLGGTITSPCPYEITGNVSLGPIKINCNLEISNDPTVTLTGPVWVKGNIEIKNSPTIKVSSSLGNKSIPMIADDPSNRDTSSKIISDNTATFEGSGGAGSYVLLLSQNNSAEQSGTEVAINIANSAQGDLLIYAGHGEILLQNNINLKEVTGYRVRAKNSAQVIYETGLANLLFTSGPSGSWTVKSWKESE